MIHLIRNFALAVSLAALSACGFQPVYSSNGGALAHSGNITVDQIDGRSGHVLRKSLLQELAAGLPEVSEPGNLNVVLKERLSRLSLNPDGAASRSSVVSRGTYVLELDGSVIVGEVEAETNFNVPTEPYADIAAQTQASDRAARLLASRIVDDIRLKLASGETGRSQTLKDAVRRKMTGENEDDLERLNVVE